MFGITLRIPTRKREHTTAAFPLKVKTGNV
jgi:hypothetical protein